MTSNPSTTNVESFDQLLWELQVLEENWAMRNPLRFYVKLKDHPEKDRLKRYACYGMILINVITWMMIAAVIIDPKMIAFVVFLVLTVAVPFCFQMVYRRVEETEFLKLRDEHMVKIQAAIARESPERRAELFQDLWSVEELHLLRNRLFLLMPWEQQISSGRLLIFFAGIVTIALLTMKSMLALFPMALVIGGLARWLTWRSVRRRKKAFENESLR